MWEGYTTAHETRVRHTRHARLEAGRVQRVRHARARLEIVVVSREAVRLENGVVEVRRALVVHTHTVRPVVSAVTSSTVTPPLSVAKLMRYSTDVKEEVA